MGNVHGALAATAADGDKGHMGHLEESVLIAAKEEELVKTELAANETEWYLSDEQKTILRECWQVLEKDIEHVGTVTFLRMFETHPETLKAFIPEVEHIKEIELDEWYREKLKVHAIRVMAVIEKTMHRLDNERQAAMILMAYGRRHNQFGVKPTMLDKMSHSFVIAIQPYLEDRWSRTMEESWHALFRRIIFFMELGYPKSKVLEARLQSLNDNEEEPDKTAVVVMPST